MRKNEYKTFTNLKQGNQIYAKMPTISNNVILVYTMHGLGPVQVGAHGNLLGGFFFLGGGGGEMLDLLFYIVLCCLEHDTGCRNLS